MNSNSKECAPIARRWQYLKIGNVPVTVADYPFLAMEHSLAKLGVEHKVSPKTRSGMFAARVLAKLRLVHPLLRVGRIAYLVPVGQLGEARYFPATCFHEIIPFCFDAWPNLWERFEALFRRHRVRIALFTARQSADHFRERLGIDAIWMPEACDPAIYRPDKPLVERSIDVLELGRKFDRYHDAITPVLAADGRIHLYEKVKGELIFSGREALTAGFADAKISVSFPSSMTHPQRSGKVETVTHRYFESIASKCLVVGHAPAELKDLFGYDPVVAADARDPAAQAREILACIGDFQALVDRNFRRLFEVGTWDVRVRSVVAELAARGYSF